MAKREKTTTKAADTAETKTEEQTQDPAAQADEDEDDSEAEPAKEPEADEIPPAEVSTAANLPQTMQVKGAEKVEPPPEPDNPDQLSDHYLDSPQEFGIWIGPQLHKFRKGKSRLTNKQLQVCLTHPYVRDNGANVYKMIKPKAKK